MVTMREIKFMEDTIVDIEQTIASINGEIALDRRVIAARKYRRKMLRREARELRVKWDDACQEFFGQIDKDRAKGE